MPQSAVTAARPPSVTTRISGQPGPAQTAHLWEVTPAVDQDDVGTGGVDGAGAFRRSHSHVVQEQAESGRTPPSTAEEHWSGAAENSSRPPAWVVLRSCKVRSPVTSGSSSVPARTFAALLPTVRLPRLGVAGQPAGVAHAFYAFVGSVYTCGFRFVYNASESTKDPGATLPESSAHEITHMSSGPAGQATGSSDRPPLRRPRAPLCGGFCTRSTG